MAGVEHFGGNLADGFAVAQNGDPDGVLFKERNHEIFKNHAVGRILVHADLLVDDAPLLFHAFLGKIGGGHKFQQQMQAVPEILGAGEIVGGHVVAGEGIGHGAQSGKFRGNIPVTGHIKEFMFQIMGNTGRGLVVLTFQGEAGMDGAVIGDEIGQLFGKAFPLHHGNGQTVFQSFPVADFIQFGIVEGNHWLPPFRK